MFQFCDNCSEAHMKETKQKDYVRAFEGYVYCVEVSTKRLGEACEDMSALQDVKGESLLRIALIRKDTEAFDLALQTVTLVTKEPYNNSLRANALVVQGLLLEKKADIPAAEMAYRTALQLVAEHGIALQRLGRVYMRYRETIEEAVTCFNQCVKIAPPDYVPWYLLGRCYMATTQVTIRCRIPRLCTTYIPFTHYLAGTSSPSLHPPTLLLH